LETLEEKLDRLRDELPSKDFKYVSHFEKAYKRAVKSLSLKGPVKWKFISDKNGVKSWQGDTGKVMEQRVEGVIPFSL